MIDLATITAQPPDDTLETEFAALLRDKSDEEIETLAYNSPAVHFACYCQIRDKNNDVISPVPNILQLRLSEAYETLSAMGVRSASSRPSPGGPGAARSAPISSTTTG